MGKAEVKKREHAEAVAVAKLASEGHVLRIWSARSRPADLRCSAYTGPKVG
jgi:hypothetical protein